MTDFKSTGLFLFPRDSNGAELRTPVEVQCCDDCGALILDNEDHQTKHATFHFRSKYHL